VNIASIKLLAESPNYKWWVLAVVQFSFLLIGVDSTIVNLALPTIANEMHAELASAQWTIAAFFTTTAVVLPIAGRLADLLGLKTVFISGFAIFTISSVACGLTNDLRFLIAMRIVQAAGAAALLANSNVLTLAVFPPKQHALAIGINGTVYSTGFALGYTLGGFLIQDFGWRSIFLVNLPIGLLAIALGMFILVESKIRKSPPPKERFDFFGAALSVISLAVIMVSFDHLARVGEMTAVLATFLLLGAVGIATFVFVELREKHPLLDVRLFGIGLFSIGLATRLLSNGIFAASAFVVPFYTQTVLGFTPIQSGLMMLPFAVAFSVAGPFSGRAADRMGSRTLTTAGFLCTGAALLLLGGLEATPGDTGLVILKVASAMALLGLGSGLFISPNSGVTLDSVPKEKTGIASGMLYCMAFLGSAIGTAFAAAFLSRSISEHGGLKALKAHSTDPAGLIAFVAAQDSIFHILLVASLLAAGLCAMRQSKKPVPAGPHL